MQEKYICYDGVDGKIYYCDDKEEAEKKLKELIKNGIEDGEWLEGVEDSFVAEIKLKIKPLEITQP